MQFLNNFKDDWDYVDMGKYVRLDRYKGRNPNIIISSEFFCKPLKLKNIDVSVIPNIKTLKSFKLLSNDDTNKIGVETPSLMYAFKQLYSLESVDLSGLDTRQVTNMYGMFFDCCNLKRVNLAGLNTSLVTDMRNMFANCTRLQSLDLSSFDVRSLKHADNMFFNNVSLQLLRMDNFNTKLLDIFKIFAYFFELYQIPLLLITKDKRLLNYKGFAGHPFNRVPLLTLMFDANGGRFKDGSNKKSYFDKVINSTEKIELSSFETYKRDIIPKKNRCTFMEWKLVEEEIKCSKSLINMLNLNKTTYQAQWKEI